MTPWRRPRSTATMPIRSPRWRACSTPAPMSRPRIAWCGSTRRSRTRCVRPAKDRAALPWNRRSTSWRTSSTSIPSSSACATSPSATSIRPPLVEQRPAGVLPRRRAELRLGTATAGRHAARRAAAHRLGDGVGLLSGLPHGIASRGARGIRRQRRGALRHPGHGLRHLHGARPARRVRARRAARQRRGRDRRHGIAGRPVLRRLHGHRELRAGGRGSRATFAASDRRDRRRRPAVAAPWHNARSAHDRRRLCAPRSKQPVEVACVVAWPPRDERPRGDRERRARRCAALQRVRPRRGVRRGASRCRSRHRSRRRG